MGEKSEGGKPEKVPRMRRDVWLLAISRGGLVFGPLLLAALHVVSQTVRYVALWSHHHGVGSICFSMISRCSRSLRPRDVWSPLDRRKAVAQSRKIPPHRTDRHVCHPFLKERARDVRGRHVRIGGQLPRHVLTPGSDGGQLLGGRCRRRRRGASSVQGAAAPRAHRPRVASKHRRQMALRMFPRERRKRAAQSRREAALGAADRGRARRLPRPRAAGG